MGHVPIDPGQKWNMYQKQAKTKAKAPNPAASSSTICAHS